MHLATVGSMEPANFLRDIVSRIVRRPDDIQIRQSETDEEIVLELTVHPKDRGRVMGHKGATSQHIRTVLAAAGGKVGKPIRLKIPYRYRL